MLRYFFLFLLASPFLTNAQQLNGDLNCAKINHVYRKACHNCYEHNMAGITQFQQALDIAQAIEIDVYSTDTDFDEAPNELWHVRQHPGKYVYDNNSNTCGNGDQWLGICLDDVQSWSERNRYHDPITIFLDLKPTLPYLEGFWKPNHQPKNLDKTILEFANSVGGLKNIYTPNDLKGEFESVRDGAFHENWPSTKDLRGKFIFVLTGHEEYFNHYIMQLEGNTLAFIAPDLKTGARKHEIEEPEGFSNLSRDQIVFYNINYADIGDVAWRLAPYGFMSRSWEDDDTSIKNYQDNIKYTINNIAVKNINGKLGINPDDYIFDLPEYEFDLNGLINDIDNTNVIFYGNSDEPTQLVYSKHENILLYGTNTASIKNATIANETHFNVEAGNEIHIYQDTRFEHGANSHIYLGNCTPSTYISRRGSSSTKENVLKTDTTANVIAQNNSRLKSKKSAVVAIIGTQQNFSTVDNHSELTYLTCPNPATNYLKVSYKYNSISPITFSLFDVAGKMIKQQVFIPNQFGIQDFVVNLENVQPGTYVFTLTVDDQRKTGRMIKTH